MSTKKLFINLCSQKKAQIAPNRHRRLMPIIVATQEGKIKKTAVQRQSGQIFCKTLSWKYPAKKLAEKYLKQ
jgi:hypothetical protein